MQNKLDYSIAQLNFIVGDIEGNYQKICKAYEKALKNNSSLLITTELALIGYPPQDLVLKESLIEKANHYRTLLTSLTTNKRCAIILGSIFKDKGKLYNAAFFLSDGKTTVITKHRLPNYGVFDEKRIFSKGKGSDPVLYNGVKLGILICEDGWFPEVADNLCKNGAEIIISINASPFDKTKFIKRLEVAENLCTKHHKPMIYANQVGGQDSIVFDGGSFVLNKGGKVVLRGRFFEEDFICGSMLYTDGGWDPKEKQIDENTPSTEKLVYKAIVLGLRDYMYKNNFDKVLLGVSGGVDSALAAVIAVDAIGAKNVSSVIMPSEYNSIEAMADAKALVKKLGIHYETIAITNLFTNFKASLNRKQLKEITIENLQSRIRGVLLMSLSNELGALLLNTSNKSELAVGYSTLYGDSCGTFSPLKDVYKTELYSLARWRNNNFPEFILGKKDKVIPDSILTRSPSAELKYDQTDLDTLPPYEVLDPILYHFVEENLSKRDIVKLGFNKAIVDKTIKMLYAAEFKRRQSPPGVKVSTMYFNTDRRYPITNKFIEENAK